MSQRIFPIEPVSGTGEAPAQQSAASPSPGTAPEALSPEIAAARGEEEHKKRIPLIWIPLVICLGLLVAAGYLGGRIYASRAHENPPAATGSIAKVPAAADPGPEPTVSQSAATQPAASNPTEITPVAPLVDKPAATSDGAPILTVRTHDDPAFAPPDDLSIIHPNAGERYVQISALNTAAAHRYVDQLRHGPLEPHLAQGPTPTILRVLIGPFGDQLRC